MDLDSALTGKPAEGADATEILRADHAEVRRLFKDYDEARGGAAHARRVLAQALCLQLELHDKLEREVFYPAMRDVAARQVADALREHDELLDAIGTVKAQADAGGDIEDEPLQRLKRLVDSHVSEEEHTFFPLAQDKLGAALKALGERLIERKKELTGSTESLEGPAT